MGTSCKTLGFPAPAQQALLETVSEKVDNIIEVIGSGGSFELSGPHIMPARIPLDLMVATEDNQTVFPINLEGFNPEKDSVTVQSGITILHPDADFFVEGTNIVLAKGVPVGRTIGIVVNKNLPKANITHAPAMIPLPLVFATEEDQTVFPIDLDSFDPETDSVSVQSGVLPMHPNADFVVNGKTIVLSEGVSEGRSIGIVVYKNVIASKGENTLSGTAITNKSISLTKLETKVATASVVVHATLSASSWADGLYVYTNTGIVSAEQVIELSPATTITSEQLKALQAANIVGVAQTAGSVTMKAFGTVPTIDIPVTFLLRGDV